MTDTEIISIQLLIECLGKRKIQFNILRHLFFSVNILIL